MAKKYRRTLPPPPYGVDPLDPGGHLLEDKKIQKVSEYHYRLPTPSEDDRITQIGTVTTSSVNPDRPHVAVAVDTEPHPDPTLHQAKAKRYIEKLLARFPHLRIVDFKDQPEITCEDEERRILPGPTPGVVTFLVARREDTPYQEN